MPGQEQEGDWWRRHYVKKMSGHVTDPPRFYLTTLFICVILMAVGGIIISIQAFAHIFDVIYPALALALLFSPLGWIFAFYIPYNQETTKAPVGLMKNGSIFTFRLEDISDLIPKTDESEDGLQRQTVYLRWFPKNGVPGWPYAYGGGLRGYGIVPQAHIRYILKENGENGEQAWVIDNAWSLNIGEIIVGGKYYMRHLDEKGNPVVTVMDNFYTTSDLVKLFRDDRPYRQTGSGKFVFPFDNQFIPQVEVPYQLIGDKERPKGVRTHSRFKDSSPIDIAYDLAAEFGGPGMNLPSHADFIFGANERIIKEMGTLVSDQRTTLTIQENLTIDKLKKERDEWQRANQ